MSSNDDISWKDLMGDLKMGIVLIPISSLLLLFGSVMFSILFQMPLPSGLVTESGGLKIALLFSLFSLLSGIFFGFLRSSPGIVLSALIYSSVLYSIEALFLA